MEKSSAIDIPLDAEHDCGVLFSVALSTVGLYIEILKLIELLSFLVIVKCTEICITFSLLDTRADIFSEKTHSAG